MYSLERENIREREGGQPNPYQRINFNAKIALTYQ